MTEFMGIPYIHSLMNCFFWEARKFQWKPILFDEIDYIVMKSHTNSLKNKKSQKLVSPKPSCEYIGKS